MRVPLLIAVLLATACGGAAPADEGSSSEDLAPPIELVSPGVYRGRRPDQATLQKLKSLGVHTILDLEDDRADIPKERQMVGALGMRFINQPMSGFWTPNDSQVNVTVGMMGDQSLRPIFVHCLHGEDRTGLIVGLFRIYKQGWKPADAYREMLQKGFHRALFLLNHYFEEETGFED